MWSAGFSDSNVNNGCTYAQEAHAILVNGAPCGGAPVTSTQTTTTVTATKTTTSTGSTSTATGTAGPYDQVSEILYYISFLLSYVKACFRGK